MAGSTSSFVFNVSQSLPFLTCTEDMPLLLVFPLLRLIDLHDRLVSSCRLMHLISLLDLSLMALSSWSSKNSWRRLCADFLSRLYLVHARDNLCFAEAKETASTWLRPAFFAFLLITRVLT